jgi:hypothetical protein
MGAQTSLRVAAALGRPRSRTRAQNTGDSGHSHRTDRHLGFGSRRGSSERTTRAWGTDQGLKHPARRMAAIRRRATADDEAETTSHQREVRSRDRSAVFPLDARLNHREVARGRAPSPGPSCLGRSTSVRCEEESHRAMCGCLVHTFWTGFLEALAAGEPQGSNSRGLDSERGPPQGWSPPTSEEFVPLASN